jgi:hypothetical protein
VFEELYKNDRRGQNIIVTGANSGIGYEIYLALARLEADATFGMPECNIGMPECTKV